MTWLQDTPQAVVAAHLEMLPRLDAEECQAAATAVAVGRGMKLGDWVRRQLTAWRRAADGRRQGKAPASAGDLAAMGIAVRTVRRG